MKMIRSWDAALCSSVEIALVIEVLSTSETLDNILPDYVAQHRKRQSSSISQIPVMKTTCTLFKIWCQHCFVIPVAVLMLVDEMVLRQFSICLRTVLCMFSKN
jgi:hypothetical protein